MINILHLSDLHLSDTNDNKREEVLNSLKEELSGFLSINNFWKPNFIVISGDLTSTGNVKEYPKVKSFLDDLIVDLKLDYTKVILTIGNHDKIRRDKENEIVKIHESDGSIRVLKGMLSDYDRHISAKLLIDNERYHLFSCYNEFAARLDLKPSEIIHVKGWDPDVEKTQGVYVHHLDNLDLIFVAINSAYYCIGGDLDYGRLRLDSRYLEEVEKFVNSFKQRSSKRAIVISVMHHNPSWFKWEDKLSLPNAPATYSRVISFSDMILSGHEHSVKYFPDLLSYSTHSIIGGATFTNDNKEKYYSNNFSIIQIDENKLSYRRKSFVFQLVEGKNTKWDNYDDENLYPFISISPNDYEKLLEDKVDLVRENIILKRIVFKNEEYSEKKIDLKVPFQFEVGANDDRDVFRKLLGLDLTRKVQFGDQDDFYQYNNNIFLKRVKFDKGDEVEKILAILLSKEFRDNKMVLVVEKKKEENFDKLKEFTSFVEKDKLLIINAEISCR